MINHALNNPTAVVVIAVCISGVLLTIAACIAPKPPLPPLPDLADESRRRTPDFPLTWDDDTADLLRRRALRQPQQGRRG
jgi:hypothetical protein